MTDSQANYEAIEALLERIRRLENADMGGWISAVEERWAFLSASDPAFVISVPGDMSWKYSIGMKIRLKQAGGNVAYFVITGINFVSTNTEITVDGGTDYDLANSKIIEPFYSTARAPYDFPLDPDVWSAGTYL